VADLEPIRLRYKAMLTRAACSSGIGLMPTHVCVARSSLVRCAAQPGLAPASCRTGYA